MSEMQQRVILALSVGALALSRSLYSVKFYQEIDWHCYSQFGSQILNGERNYGKMLCDYGWNVYGAFMSYVMTLMHWITAGDASKAVLIHAGLWAFVSFLSVFVYFPLMADKRSHTSRFFWIVSLALPWLEQSPVRAGVSRVTNDLFVALFTVLFHGAIHRRVFTLSTILFALLLSLKLNSLILAPAVLVIYLKHLPSSKIVLHMLLGAGLMILMALPFILGDARQFFGLAYDFSRLFEHRVNMAWGFLGDDVRHAQWFNYILLAATAASLLSFLYLLWRSSYSHKEVMSLAGSAVVSYAFMRGVHMQFSLWIWPFLPFVLMSGARLHPLVTLATMLVLDWCHSWVSNVVRVTELLRAFYLAVHYDFRASLSALLAAFTQLRSAKEYSEEFPVRMLGQFYQEGFSWTVIPSSSILCLVTVAIVWRICYVLAHWDPKPVKAKQR